MKRVEDCNLKAQSVSNGMNRVKSEWTENETISDNHSNPTLLYIAVEYVKDEFKAEPAASLSPCSNFSNLQQHVSTLDPNMSSVARYSPIYNDTSTNYNPVVIHQLVSSKIEEEAPFVNSLDTNSSLENFPAVLCNTDLNSVNNQYLHMVDHSIVSTDSTNNLPGVTSNGHSNKEPEVEILITDQATGISYSVSTQDILVEEQQLLEALSPDPLLDSDLLTIDESTLKNNLPEDLIDTDNTTVEPSIVTNFIADFPANSLKEYCEKNRDEFSKLRKRNAPDEVECENKLLSCVYSIIDKPIQTRARASLPETYLRIAKIGNEWGVFAKKCIRKRTQFGPVQGDLKQKETVTSNQNKLELLLVDEEEKVMSMDLSNEDKSNWMCFIRKAETYEEQNLVVSQHEKSLFFTVIRNVLPKQELKVGYSYFYASQHNLSVLDKVASDEQWPCFECTEQFGTSQDLQNHLNTHEDKGVERVKFRKRSWRNKRKLVKMATAEACQCRICKQVFNPPKCNVLKNHLQYKHDIVGEPIEDHYFIIRNYKCEKCYVVFNSESLFKIHNLLHNSDASDDKSDDETHHVCPSCSRKFPTQRQLVTHVSVHSLPKYKMIPERFQCPICYTFYPLRERLQRHLLVHGPEESKPIQCPKCKKRFMNQSALTCHLKTHLSGQNIYECPICKDRFDQVPKLKMHVQKHCVNNTYTCPHCNKKFKAYCIIRKHIRAFHSEQKHTCQHCSKYFHTIDKLKMHLLRHSDHKEFLCSDCGKQFKRKDKLTEHCKRVHSEERENKVPIVAPVDKKETKKFIPKVEPTDFHRFIYKCHPCLIGFKRRGMLVNHLAKRHPDISLDSVPELNLPILRATKDYYCQYCDKVYKSNSKRKAHIVKNHPGAALPISNRKRGTYPEVAGLPNPSFSQTVGSVTTSPQNCSWCHKQYASKAKLLQHQRKEHVEYLELSDGALIDQVKSVDSAPEELEDNIDPYKSNEMAIPEKILATNALEEFVDDPEPVDQYCHLANVDGSDVFQQVDNLNLPSSHLYRLLTTANTMVPPR